MGSSVIDALKNTLGMGARTNKYKVIINGRGGGPSGNIVDVLAKSADIPSRSFTEIAIWNQGRLTNIAGASDFGSTWSVTFMDDASHTLRGQFVAWMEFIDSVASHSRAAGAHSAYMGDATIQQLDTSHNGVTASYTFSDVWPKSISASTMSDDNSAIIEFTVEFNYTSWSKG